jgi:hypothetical protein
MRQKAKIASFEQQVEELSEQLKQAHTECASLKNLNTILEQVLNLRDEHINGLQQAAHVLSPNGAKRPASEISSESDSLASGELLGCCWLGCCWCLQCLQASS